MDCFRRALAIGKHLTDARLELALLCERRHQLEEASSLIAECLRLDPAYHAAALIQARHLINAELPMYADVIEL